MEIDNKENIIYLKNFKRLLTSQAFFVWNDLEIPSANTDLLDTMDDEENTDSIWEIFLNPEDTRNIDITANIYKKLEEAAFDFLSNKFNKNEVFINTETEIEVALKKTLDAIQDEKMKLIINPVFKYKNAVAKIAFYDKQNKKIGAIKFTTSTKLSDYIKAFYDFSIATAFFEIKQYSLIILNYKDNYLKNEIDFHETFYANTTKTKRSSKKDIFYFEKKLRSSGESDESETIYEKISSRMIKKNLDFMPFDLYLSQINQALEIKNRLPLNQDDNTDWGENPFLKELIKLDCPKYSDFSGKVISKNEIISNNPKESKIRRDIEENRDEIRFAEIENVIKSLKEKNARIIWYDFESYSLPYSAIDNYLPYKQIPFQLSIIETLNDKIISKNNLVYDPLNYTNENFIEIINTIYSKKADSYVVYNKSYENTRLKEMCENLKTTKNKLFGNVEKLNDLNKRIEYIISKTVDLAELFIPKVDQTPIFLSELKGFYSIKKIEKYITKNQIKLKNNIVPYSTLEVKDGLMAMKLGIKRSLNIIGNEEWKKEKENLKKYCENDVRAMLMVYDFAIYMQNNSFKGEQNGRS
ncbi:DUF2779 domain-containing protein [[Mycoplasma] mobile]|uniref:Expressed protein n=1 Tax=Mycoplasma mobile (strain ATCC 43663 / 163K / NCTC 11711) TaxID=267748 RepID=Q6KHY3_MYCM1|nr:DUF2779 domain-containing protein [[Mycoplasma] mobile]AAT27793.1 expressed protein [Mycoplasma mobile 163K]